MMKMKDFSCEELKALAVELPDEVNRYKMAGDFEGAAKAIDRWMDKPVGEEIGRASCRERVSSPV